jgi:hypothetical protein
VTTANPFTLSCTDGTALTPPTSDTLLLKVFALRVGPASATPIYQASRSMVKANSVVVKQAVQSLGAL